MFKSINFETKKDVTVKTVTTKILNTRSGDIDQVVEYTFYNKLGIDLGFARVSTKGQHRKVQTDGQGRKLLELVLA